MVGTCMRCGNGRTLYGRLTWLGHACAVGTDGLYVNVNMVGTCMRCENGRTLCGHLTWLGHACSVGTDGLCVDI